MMLFNKLRKKQLFITNLKIQSYLDHEVDRMNEPSLLSKGNSSEEAGE
jgi:hypothetical protein